MKSDVIDLTVQLLSETDKAVLVTEDIPENGVWLPRSQIEIAAADVGGLHIVTLPEWLANEKGMI